MNHLLANGSPAIQRLISQKSRENSRNSIPAVVIIGTLRAISHNEKKKKKKKWKAIHISDRNHNKLILQLAKTKFLSRTKTKITQEQLPFGNSECDYVSTLIISVSLTYPEKNI